MKKKAQGVLPQLLGYQIIVLRTSVTSDLVVVETKEETVEAQEKPPNNVEGSEKLEMTPSRTWTSVSTL